MPGRERARERERSFNLTNRKLNDCIFIRRTIRACFFFIVEVIIIFCWFLFCFLFFFPHNFLCFTFDFEFEYFEVFFLYLFLGLLDGWKVLSDISDLY